MEDSKGATAPGRVRNLHLPCAFHLFLFQASLTLTVILITARQKQNNLVSQNLHILFSFPCRRSAKPLKHFHGVEMLVLNQSMDKTWQVRQGLEQQDPVTRVTLVYLHPPTLRSSCKKAEWHLSSASQKFQSRAVILRGNSSFSLQEIINLLEICQINFLPVSDCFFQLMGPEPPHKWDGILMVKFTSVLSKEVGKFNNSK